MKGSSFKKNLGYAFGAQGISLVLSIIITLFIPRILGLENFSLWQLFLFYSGFVGFFSFGLNDGIYLRFGGKKYNELNHRLIGTQFHILIGFQAILAILFSIVATNLMESPERLFVIYATLIFLVISSIWGFLGFIFQAVNQTHLFSKSVMIDKISFLIGIIVILTLRSDDFRLPIIFFILSRFISASYCVFLGRRVVFVKPDSFAKALKEIFLNIKIGISLMLANIAAMFILGVGRFTIDNVWGLASFGKISFALTLINFFLLFISQASMVLFPALRQIEVSKQKLIYREMRLLLGLFLPFILVMYVPLQRVLSGWLPQYTESFRYLILLLPICTFEGKMQLLCTTFFKVLRKERLLLKINALSSLMSLILSLIGVWIFGSMDVVVLFMTISIALRSIVAEVYLARFMKNSILNNLVQEIILVIVFIASSWFLDSLFAIFVFAFSYAVYLIFNRTSVAVLLEKIRLVRKN